MIKCGKCNNDRNPDDSNYCEKCGSQLQTALVQVSTGLDLYQNQGQLVRWIQEQIEVEFSLIEAVEKNNLTWEIWGKDLATYKAQLKVKTLAQEFAEIRRKTVIAFAEARAKQIIQVEKVRFNAQIEQANLAFMFNQLSLGTAEIATILKNPPYNTMSQEVKEAIALNMHQTLLKRIFGV